MEEQLRALTNGTLTLKGEESSHTIGEMVGSLLLLLFKLQNIANNSHYYSLCTMY